MPIGSGSNTKKIETSKMHVVNGASPAAVAYGEIVVNIAPGADDKDNGVKNGYFAFVDDFVIKDSASKSRRMIPPRRKSRKQSLRQNPMALPQRLRRLPYLPPQERKWKQML